MLHLISRGALDRLKDDLRPVYKTRHPLLDVDNLHPVSPIAHRIATGFAEFARVLVDLVDRKVIRLFTGRDEVLTAWFDPDSTRLRLGREIGDVGELPGVGSHGEQGDFVGVRSVE